MRPISQPKFANVGRIASEKRFSLDLASTPHLVQVLTDLYSRPIDAFVRELSTNALDSHIFAKNLDPIRVTLPSYARPFFVVEDFGLGLGIDDLEDVYTLYGASTKRESDDVNGVLGLGCKAPLTYTDTFTITSRKDGVQVIAVVAKDTEGVPVLRILDTSATSEPNGVRIEVPVQERHFGAVAKAAENLYRYWRRGTVLVDGVEPSLVWDDPTLIWLDDDVAVAPSGRGSSVLVQHNVAYPIDPYKLRDSRGGLLNFSIIAFVPSGTVSFPPSREALYYDDRTEETIALLAEYAEDAFKRSLEQRLAQVETPYDKLKFVQEWRSLAPSLANGYFKQYGTHLRLGQHGFGWRYRPTAYHHKATKVIKVSAADIIGDFPLIVGYDRKTLTERARLQIDTYFDGTDLPREYILIPSGSRIDVTDGRANVLDWDTIDAATSHVRIAPSGGSKGQTEYTLWQAGRCLGGYVLKDAKALAADEGLTVAYTVEWSNRNRWGTTYSDHARTTSGKLGQDVVVYELRQNQVDKIVRETGAVDAHDLVSQRLQAARAALTPSDIFRARYSLNSYFLGGLAGHVEQIEDPDVRAIIVTLQADESDRLRAYRALGGDVHSLPSGEGRYFDLVSVTASRYPLLADRNLHYVRQDIVDDALLLLNTKYQALRKDQP